MKLKRRTSSLLMPTPAPRTWSNLWIETLLGVVRKLSIGRLSIILPDGSIQTVTGSRSATPAALLHIHRARAAKRLLKGGGVGFAEAYIDGDWSSPDLPALLELAALNQAHLGRRIDGYWLARFWNRLRHLTRPNSRRGSRRNIAEHYDLGNAFYGAWLDPGMTYSSAWFEHAGQPLEDAQTAKYRRLADRLALRPEHHVLESGCGWGGFAEFAARRFGCRVTGITLSREQLAFATERIAERGLDDRVSIRLEDYRDVRGRYDRIASIEMFEAVGESHWPDFFAILRDRLVAGGKAGLQIITIDEDRFESYRRGADFIQRYIFPGGMLPSSSALRREIEHAGLRLAQETVFGESYARTLARWRQHFLEAWPRIAHLSFDERFKRMWEYYLGYCEAGFRAGSINVGQLLIERD